MKKHKTFYTFLYLFILRKKKEIYENLKPSDI